MNTPSHGALDQQQASSTYSSGPVLAPKNIDSDRSSPPEVESFLDPDSISKTLAEKGPRLRACSPCRLSKVSFYC